MPILEKYKPKCVFHTAAVPVTKIENPNVSGLEKDQSILQLTF